MAAPQTLARIPVVLESNDDVRFYTDWVDLARHSEVFLDQWHERAPYGGIPSPPPGGHVLSLQYSSGAVALMLSCLGWPSAHVPQTQDLTTALMEEILGIVEAYRMLSIVQELLQRLRQGECDPRFILVVHANLFEAQNQQAAARLDFAQYDSPPIQMALQREQLDFAEAYFQLEVDGLLDEWTKRYIPSMSPPTPPGFKGSTGSTLLDLLREDMHDFGKRFIFSPGSSFDMHCRDKCHFAVKYNNNFVEFRRNLTPMAWATYARTIYHPSLDRMEVAGAMFRALAERGVVDCSTCLMRLRSDFQVLVTYSSSRQAGDRRVVRRLILGWPKPKRDLRNPCEDVL